MSYEEKLERAGYMIKESAAAAARPFESAVQTGDLIFVSGHAARDAGELKYTGIVGDSITMEQAQEAAVLCFINCLKAVKNVTGSLDAIKQIVNIKGYVASTPEFIGQPQVMNAVSQLVNDVFGSAGKHSRVALGTSSLPGGTPVEVEMIVQVK